jgi:hypothetical protein
MSADENVFYRDDDILVSDKRFVSAGVTYAMPNIASVAAGVHSPRKIGWVLALLLGLVSLPLNPFFGIPISALAAWSLYRRRKAHVVILRDASGETNALLSPDKAKIAAVVAALNRAIIDRSVR